jgi:hypothetical protein
LTVLRKGYGKIVQVMRLGNSEKKRKKDEAEAVGDGKKGVNAEKKTLTGKRLALPESF